MSGERGLLAIEQPAEGEELASRLTPTEPGGSFTSSKARVIIPQVGMRGNTSVRSVVGQFESGGSP